MQAGGAREWGLSAKSGESARICVLPLDQRRLWCQRSQESAGDEALLQASTGNERVPEGSLGLPRTPTNREVVALRTNSSLNLLLVFMPRRSIQGGLLGQVSRA